MRDLLLNKIVPDLLYTVVTIILGIITYYVKKFWIEHKSFLDLQRQQLIQKIGIDKYNQDVAAVKEAVKTVEQLGKEFDWVGTIKHSKVLELIEGKTGLTSDEIYNIIKATVLEVNKPKDNNTIINNATVQ
jgi:hypothetical protein